LAGRFADRYLLIAGTTAGILFVFIGILDRVLLDLPGWMGSRQEVTTSVLGFIPVRLAVLRTAVVAFGVFAWRVNAGTSFPGRWSKLWSGFGYLVLLASIVFVFVFIPNSLDFCRVEHLFFCVARDAENTGSRLTSLVR
jgi:hypothetical protein